MKKNFGMLMIIGALMTLTVVARTPRTNGLNDVPRTTLAERLATKHDAQAEALRYSSGRGYRKIPRGRYRTYYKEHLKLRKERAPRQSDAAYHEDLLAESERRHRDSV